MSLPQPRRGSSGEISIPLTTHDISSALACTNGEAGPGADPGLRRREIGGGSREI